MLRPALLVAVLAAGVVAGTASAAPPRTAEATYVGGSTPAVTVLNRRLPPPPSVTVLNRRVSGAGFDTLSSERTVQVRVRDASGARVGGTVTQVLGGRTVVLGSFCGSSVPLRLAAPGQRVQVARTYACGAPTTGSLTVTFR